jgi:hypothetical protein
MSGAVLLLPLIVFKAYTGTTLRFIFNAALSPATDTFYMCDPHRPQKFYVLFYFYDTLEIYFKTSSGN